MIFQVKKFTELSITELYQLLKLRSEIFVVEQNSIYLDVDDKDQKALHILGFKNNTIVAYARIFKPQDYFKNASIGRVLVKQTERKFGYGNMLIQASIQAIEKYFNTIKITISAQLYLQKFYQSHGFIASGEQYLEDNIPHIKMHKNN